MMEVYGEKGFVTDLVENLVNESRFDGVYVCGPEIMMYKTVQLAHSNNMFCFKQVLRG